MSPNLKEAPDDFVTAYVGLGANLGDAQATLRAALSQMDRLAHTRLVSCSSFYRTEPIDSFGDDYINAIACLTTKLSPADLLSSLQEIETRYGRVRPAGVHNAPRTLDLDLLLYADLKSEDPELTLPHPRMKNRAFVLVPLFEIAPAGFASLDLLPDVLLPGVSGQRITCVTKTLFLSPTERGGF